MVNLKNNSLCHPKNSLLIPDCRVAPLSYYIACSHHEQHCESDMIHQIVVMWPHQFQEQLQIANLFYLAKYFHVDLSVCVNDDL
jgi:hypothetical protein